MSHFRECIRLAVHVLVMAWTVAAHAHAHADAALRTMVIVAHQDDDIPVMYPDLTARLNRTTPFQTVYLTNGNAGLECSDYTRGREEGVKEVHARLVGVPNVWHDEEQLVHGKLIRFAMLQGTRHSLAFFGFPNSPEKHTSLEWLWSDPKARLKNMAIDGRSRVDSYTKDELIETLHGLMETLRPEDVRILDASQRQPEFYPFDHTDHVHSALFGLAALQRYGHADTFTMYRGYNVQLEPKNLSEEQTKTRASLIDMYNTHDQKICDTGKVVICGKKTRCYPPALFRPFQSRRYVIEIAMRKSTVIRTKFGRCLQVKPQGSGPARVTLHRCDKDGNDAHWSIEKTGRIRHLESGMCLATREMKLGSALTLAACKSEFRQRFYVTEQGQLRGPNASCVRSGLRDPVIKMCGLRMLQASFRLDRDLPAPR